MRTAQTVSSPVCRSMSGLPAHISISCSSSLLPLLTCAGHCRQRIISIRSDHVWSYAVVAHVCKSCSSRQGNDNHVTCSVLVLVLQYTLDVATARLHCCILTKFCCLDHHKQRLPLLWKCKLQSVLQCTVEYTFRT